MMLSSLGYPQSLRYDRYEHYFQLNTVEFIL